MIVSTEAEIKDRTLELKAIERMEKDEIDEKRKNKDFTQTYPQGWQTLRRLINLNSKAAALYSFLAENIDSGCGAVVADQPFLAKQLKVSVRTIQRWILFLEKENAIAKIPVSGKIYAYALNPREVWKGYNTSKEYAAFVTKTLVNFDGDIKRKLQGMFTQNLN